jgi:hypothetical protein
MQMRKLHASTTLIPHNPRYIDVINQNIYYPFKSQSAVEDYIEKVSKGLFDTFVAKKSNEYAKILPETLAQLALYRRYFSDQMGELNERETFKILNEYIPYLNSNHIDTYGLNDVLREIREHKMRTQNQSSQQTTWFEKKEQEL